MKRLTSHTKEAGEILLEDDCRGYQTYQLQGRRDCWLPQVSGMIYCQGDKNIITVLDPQAFHPKDHGPLNDLKRVEK